VEAARPNVGGEILRNVGREPRGVDFDEFDEFFGDHDDTFLEGPPGPLAR
jgi:hypothetical protein